MGVRGRHGRYGGVLVSERQAALLPSLLVTIYLCQDDFRNLDFAGKAEGWRALWVGREMRT